LYGFGADWHISALTNASVNRSDYPRRFLLSCLAVGTCGRNNIALDFSAAQFWSRSPIRRQQAATHPPSGTPTGAIEESFYQASGRRLYLILPRSHHQYSWFVQSETSGAPEDVETFKHDAVRALHPRSHDRGVS
jgi:hypothetical protein